MGTGRIDIGSIRREQIVSAAVAVIAEQGIQNLSLSSIEEKTGMSRGQLTYYFRRMEDILLAVFDHLVRTMRQRVGATECAEFDHSSWPWIEYLLRMILTGPANPTFGPLQYTFLAQMSHRPDFRERLAGLYEEWRSNMGAGLALDLAKTEAPPPFPPRALSTLVQALLHGLAMQRAVDPDAFDRQEVLALCLDVLGSYLGRRPPRPRRPARKEPLRKASRKKEPTDQPGRSEP